MELKLDKEGLIPAIAQDAESGKVLMLGYMNPGSLKRTIEGVQVWFYSRSREDLWHKGEVTGHYLNLKEAWLDCDGDTILLRVIPDGPTCHTGNDSCFYRQLDHVPEARDYQRTDSGSGVLGEIFAVIQDRKNEIPEGSYTAKLLEGGVGRIAQKVAEEAGETVIAAVQQDAPAIVASEVADLLYHVLVLMAASNVKPQQVWLAGMPEILADQQTDPPSMYQKSGNGLLP